MSRRAGVAAHAGAAPAQFPGAVRKLAAIAVALAVALPVPAILLGNGLWLLANGWYVHAEYARPGFPDDRYGFTKEERTELALTGLRSIQPQSADGVEALREARLRDGSVAFGEREVAHMADVRSLVGRVLLVHALAVLLLAAAALASRALRLGALRRGLAGGGLLTLGLAAALGAYMLVNFDGFFVQFHEALFAGDSWRFPSTDTLIRLYPDAFWSDFGAALAGLTVVQAVALAGGLWWSRHRRSQPRPAGPDGAAAGEPARLA